MSNEPTYLIPSAVPPTSGPFEGIARVEILHEATSFEGKDPLPGVIHIRLTVPENQQEKALTITRFLFSERVAQHLLLVSTTLHPLLDISKRVLRAVDSDSPRTLMNELREMRSLLEKHIEQPEINMLLREYEESIVEFRQELQRKLLLPWVHGCQHRTHPSRQDGAPPPVPGARSHPRRLHPRGRRRPAARPAEPPRQSDPVAAGALPPPGHPGAGGDPPDPPSAAKEHADRRFTLRTSTRCHTHMTCHTEGGEMPKDRDGTPGATKLLSVRVTPQEFARIEKAMGRIVQATGVEISLSAFVRSAVFTRVEQEESHDFQQNVR